MANNTNKITQIPVIASISRVPIRPQDIDNFNKFILNQEALIEQLLDKTFERILHFYLDFDTISSDWLFFAYLFNPTDPRGKIRFSLLYVGEDEKKAIRDKYYTNIDPESQRASFKQELIESFQITMRTVVRQTVDQIKNRTIYKNGRNDEDILNLFKNF